MRPKRLYGIPSLNGLAHFTIDQPLLAVLCRIAELRGAWNERKKSLTAADQFALREAAAIDTGEAIGQLSLRRRAATPGETIIVKHSQASIDSYLAAFRRIEQLVAKWPPTADELKTMHRSVLAGRYGGVFKQKESDVSTVDEKGNERIVALTVPARHVARAIDNLVLRADALRGCEPVLLAGAFVCDLVIIHPFTDGNGRMVRLAGQASLVALGHDGLAYVSFERVFKRRRAHYFEALKTTRQWRDAPLDLNHWGMFYAITVKQAYEDLFAQLDRLI